MPRFCSDDLFTFWHFVFSLRELQCESESFVNTQSAIDKLVDYMPSCKDNDGLSHNEYSLTYDDGFSRNDCGSHSKTKK